MLGLSAATVLSLLGGIVCLRGEPAYGAAQRCDAWGGEGGLDSAVVAELVRSSTPGKQLCFEVREDVQVLQQLSVPAGVSLEVRGRGGHAPVVSAAGLREGRAITVARGARLVLHGLVVADAPHGAVWSSGGDVRVSSCSFEHNVAAAAEVTQDQPAAQWSTVYAGSVLGLTVATRITSGSGRSSLGAQAAAGAAGMLLLPSSVTAPECCVSGVTSSSCCYRSKHYDTTNASKTDFDFASSSICERSGGAICVEDSHLEVEDSSFVGNTAHKGGAIYWSNINDVGKSFHVFDSIFRSNQAREDDSPNLSGYAGSGGAIFVKGSPTADAVNADPVFLRDVDFQSNVAYSRNERVVRRELVYGGALSVVNMNIIAQRCDFTHNGVAESSDADQHAYGGAIAVRATVPDLKVTLESCLFERNDAKEGHAIYSTEGGTEEEPGPAPGPANFGGVTLAVVNCTFAQNGQLRYGYDGVLTGGGFDAYEGQLFTIVSDSPVQYVESNGLGIEDINLPGRAGAKTVACTEATVTQAAVCPILYFGRTRMWRDEYEVVNIYDLANVDTTPGGTPFTSDPDAVQCVDCSVDRPSDCNGFELGVRCTTWEVDSDGEKVAVCASNGYGTACDFCGFSELAPVDGDAPARSHTCGITSTGAAAGNCTASGPGQRGFRCACNPGWNYNMTSRQCDIDIDECWSGPCQNGGTCLDSSEDVRVAPDSYRCDCIAGWGGVAEPAFSGDDCETDVDECASTPCLHASFCIESELLVKGAGSDIQQSSGGWADPPVDLFFAQPACAVEENWQPASWPKTDTVPEPNYIVRTMDELNNRTERMYDECRADIETLVGEDWEQFGPDDTDDTDDTRGIQLPNGVDLNVQDFDVDGPIRDALIQAFKEPVNNLRRYSNNAPFNIIAIWCMIKGGDMTLWPWWCDEARTSMGACEGVNLTYIEYGDGYRRRYASPSITANRSTFAPFLIEQLGQQAYNLGTPDTNSDVQHTPKLTQVLDRLECRALGGCCPAFNGDKPDSSTRLPYIDPDSEEFDWAPTDSRRTTDCQKEYHDQCRAGNGGASPVLVPGTGLYDGCTDSSCGSVASGACVYSGDRPDKWKVSAIDYFQMVQAEPTWAQGQLFINCNSGFDFGTHSHPEGRQYYREDIAICRSCTSMVPVGAFGCWCEPGWGWDNAPTLPRDVYETSTGKQVIPAPPIDTRVGVDNCDFQQDNCYDWELETQPCLNGGTCVNQVNDYKCECTGAWLLGPGWEGKQCEQCEGMLNIFCEDRWITLVVCLVVFVFCTFVAHKR